MAENTGESKLMEEVKLFWQIQLAVPVALGYLFTNLTMDSLKPNALIKDIGLLVVVGLITIIGAIYNLIGNYYARVSDAPAKVKLRQENCVTPALMRCYLFLGGTIGSGAVCVFILDLALQSGGWNKTLLGFCAAGGAVGALTIWVVCKLVFHARMEKGADKYDEGDYATPLKRIFFCSH